MHRLSGLIAAFCLFCATNSFAQEVTPAAASTATTDTGGFHMTKSPLEAILLSAAIPGAGQLYLDQAWKLPIIYGLLGGFFYGEQIQNRRLHETQDEMNGLYAKQTATDSLKADRLQSSREFYRDDRDKWWIYLGITYIVQILDAYIAAHLYDFDVSNPSGGSTIQSYYDPFGGRGGLSYTFRF
jgi:hypothetical protein